MTIATYRLAALRAIYLLIGAWMGFLIWPGLIHHAVLPEYSRGVAQAMFGSLTALCFLGVIQPLRMLPLLLFEIGWKIIWLSAIALPAWRTGTLDPKTASSVPEIASVLLVILVVPWDYVARTYLRWERSGTVA